MERQRDGETERWRDREMEGQSERGSETNTGRLADYLNTPGNIPAKILRRKKRMFAISRPSLNLNTLKASRTQNSELFRSFAS